MNERLGNLGNCDRGVLGCFVLLNVPSVARKVLLRCLIKSLCVQYVVQAGTL